MRHSVSGSSGIIAYSPNDFGSNSVQSSLGKALILFRHQSDCLWELTKREKLEACLEYLREGDTLVVTKIDRLARSTWHLCQITNELVRKKVLLQKI